MGLAPRPGELSSSSWPSRLHSFRSRQGHSDSLCPSFFPVPCFAAFPCRRRALVEGPRPTSRAISVELGRHSPSRNTRRPRPGPPEAPYQDPPPPPPKCSRPFVAGKKIAATAGIPPVYLSKLPPFRALVATYTVVPSSDTSDWPPVPLRFCLLAGQPVSQVSSHRLQYPHPPLISARA